MSAREDMLARIRAALAGRQRANVSVPRAYRGQSAQPPGDPGLVELFSYRVEDYRAGVRRVTLDQLAAAVAEAVAAGLGRRERSPTTERALVVVPPGLDDRWLAAIPGEVLCDEGLDAAALDGCDAAVTAAAVAIAETGTIVLDASPDQGRRALTLVPDVHVCLVRAEQIVASVPDALAQIDPTRPLTWISGPSATSDIELERVEGVHGPRILEVVVIEDDSE